MAYVRAQKQPQAPSTLPAQRRRDSSEDEPSAHASLFDADLASHSDFGSPLCRARSPAHQPVCVRPSLPHGQVFKTAALQVRQIEAAHVPTISPLTRLRTETSARHQTEAASMPIANRTSLSTLRTASFSTSDISTLVQGSIFADAPSSTCVSRSTRPATTRESYKYSAQGKPAASAPAKALPKSALPTCLRAYDKEISRRRKAASWPLDADVGKLQGNYTLLINQSSCEEEQDQLERCLERLNPQEYPRKPPYAGYRHPSTPPWIHHWRCGMASGYVRRQPSRPGVNSSLHFRGYGGHLQRHTRRRSGPPGSIVPSCRGLRRRTRSHHHPSEIRVFRPQLNRMEVSSTSIPRNGPVRHSSESVHARARMRSSDSMSRLERPCSACQRTSNRPWSWTSLGLAPRRGIEGNHGWCNRCAWRQLIATCCPW